MKFKSRWLSTFRAISLSHEDQNPPFLGYCMYMLALVKDSRPFKQREKRLLKVVAVNLPLYKQLHAIPKSCLFYLTFDSLRGEETLKRG